MATSDLDVARITDEALRAWAEGRELDAREWAARSEDLPEVERLLALVRDVAAYRTPLLPAVPGYRLLREIGRGGMGVVYAAEQRSLQRQVALKVLPGYALLDERARQRFRQEARVLAQVRHDHVVPVYDIVERGDLCAFAMELVDGQSLASVIARADGQPPQQRAHAVAALGAAIARALAEVHGRGLLHRDVKPSNILIRADGTALLSDFGLARTEDATLHTRSGDFVGTLAYAAPEQLRGDQDRVGPTADIFALGATLYHALTGQPPSPSGSLAERLRAAELGIFRRLTSFGLPRDLDTIVATCLEPEPGRRYASAAALAEDLGRLLALQPILARRTPWSLRAVKLLRRNRRTVLVASATALLVAASATGLLAELRSRWTLPGRVAAELTAARLALLEPAHGERVLFARTHADLERDSRFMADAGRAAAGYVRALALAPERDDIRTESEVAELARGLLQEGDANAPSAFLAHACPLTTVTAQALASRQAAPDDVALARASRADRRALGLLGFLGGRVDLCHRAWGGLDLSLNEPDAFVDAAHGQLLHAEGEHARAYPRLLRAADAFPQAGFLVVRLAECACQLGDVEQAERLLDAAQGLAWHDALGTKERVRAAVLVKRGKVDEARVLLERTFAEHGDALACVALADLLESQGQLAAATDVVLEQVEHGVDPSLRPRLMILARRWWASLTPAARASHVRACLEPADSAPRLRRIAALGSWSIGRATKADARGVGFLCSAAVAWMRVDLLRRVPKPVKCLMARLGVALDRLLQSSGQGPIGHEPPLFSFVPLVFRALIGLAELLAPPGGIEGPRKWVRLGLKQASRNRA